jgi:hypothetical protein
MWTGETNRKIEKVLHLISAASNLRPHPTDPSIKLFDEGVIRVISTGITCYELLDGTKAYFGTGLDICLTILLPDGERVTISSSYGYCGACLAHISADSRYCPTCGQHNTSAGARANEGI